MHAVLIKTKLIEAVQLRCSGMLHFDTSKWVCRIFNSAYNFVGKLPAWHKRQPIPGLIVYVKVGMLNDAPYVRFPKDFGNIIHKGDIITVFMETASEIKMVVKRAET